MKHGRRKSKSNSTDQLIGEQETVTVKKEVIEEEEVEKEETDDYYMESNAKRPRYIMDDLDDVNDEDLDDGMDIKVIDEIVEESEEEDEDDTLEMFDSIVNDIQVKPSTTTVLNQRTAPTIDSSALTLSASLTFAIEKIDFHKTTEETVTSPIANISDGDHIEEPETNTGTNPETNPASCEEDELSLNLEDMDDDDNEESDVQTE